MLNLKELRTEKNLTQQEVADKIGTSRQVYANWENEINQPDLKMLISLSEFFGVSADFLLGRTDDFGHVSVSVPPLSEEETDLLTIYRGMNSAQKMRFVAYGEGIISGNARKS